MNQDLPSPHPDEQLAAYVDGSASPAELDAVDAHLAGCALCREELELARSARSALSALPQLEGPGLDAEDLAARGATPEPIPIRAIRAKTWERLAWGSGLAAAAAIVAVFLIMGGFLGDRNGDFPASAPEMAPAQRRPALLQGGEHTTDSLASLARSLASEARTMEDSSGETLMGAEDAHGPAAATSAATVEEIVDCVQRGAGLGSEVQPSYLEQATFQGIPAYIGAFIVPGTEDSPPHLELIVVSQDECEPLYFARESL